MTEFERQMIEAILNENPRDCPLHSLQSTLERYQQVIARLYEILNEGVLDKAVRQPN